MDKQEKPSSFKSATEQIIAFRNERDWKQFHTLKDLAVALSVESAEILELFLWKGSSEVRALIEDVNFKARIAEEVGDILIYVLIFCHEAGIDPGKAIGEKLKKNRERYPVHLARGSAKKYTELGL